VFSIVERGKKKGKGGGGEEGGREEKRKKMARMGLDSLGREKAEGKGGLDSSCDSYVVGEKRRGGRERGP